MPYCIYTNFEVPETRGNLDHVIPLSLGGCDDFVVWSDKDTNSRIGSSVDGAMVNDPFFAMALRHAAARGHSGKPREPVWRHTEIDGRPAQVTWTTDGPRLWDARSKRILADKEVTDKPIQSRLNIGRFTATRYLAKVALGGGYFIYGDIFKNAADCDGLRKLITWNPKAPDASLRSSQIAVCDRHHPDSNPGGTAYLHRVCCEIVRDSILIAVPHVDAVAFHVGVTGAYVGSILVPAETRAFPKADQHDLGHVLITHPGKFERLAYRQFVGEVSTEIKRREKTQSPSPPGEA